LAVGVHARADQPFHSRCSSEPRYARARHGRGKPISIQPPSPPVYACLAEVASTSETKLSIFRDREERLIERIAGALHCVVSRRQLDQISTRDQLGEVESECVQAGMALAAGIDRNRCGESEIVDGRWWIRVREFGIG